MSAQTSALRPGVPNRRRRVRHKIQTPAYASFTGESKGVMLDLHEIVDISEDGVAIQCPTSLDPDRRVNLCLDLAECEQPIYTSGQVIWSSGSGRAGLRFLELPPSSLFRLREWLFLNAIAGVANSDVAIASPTISELTPGRPDYTDTLAAVSAVQREVESLGPDLGGALQLIATRAQTLVRATGAAIALATADSDFMDCRSSAGPGAPPVGARLQVGSGFSGECVKSGRLLRCDDSETDPRVDSESCRALGIRSILAVPVRVGDKSIGLVEAFSDQPNAFSEADSRAVQRLADTVVASVNRAARAENLPTLSAPATTSFAPAGSVLFASAPKENEEEEVSSEKESSGITLPRSHLILLVGSLAAVSLALGVLSAPLIQAKFRQRGQSHLPTVLASSQAPKSDAVHPSPSVETATIDQLKQMAENGNPAAENALGRRYFEGDEKNGIPQDEKQAFRWFSSAAEHGNLAAQKKLGSLYWGGRGVPKDFNRAYFWTVLARARGDEDSRALAAVLASGMTPAQAAVIEEQANLWLQQQSAVKAAPGR